MAVLVGVLALLGAPPAGAVLKSDNVSLVTKLPEAAGAASGRFSPDGKTFYVSTWKGLHVYDISKPDDPQRKGFLPLPHFENEDVDAGDGIVIVSNDPSEGVGVIYVIDVTDPSLPKIRSVMPNGFISTVGNLVESPNNTGHIANCIQGCKWLWLTGTAQGLEVVDLRDPDKPAFVKTIPMPVPKARGTTDPAQLKPGFTHDVFVDRSGIGWVTGQDGTFGFDTANPTDPALVYRSDENVTNSGQDGPDGTGEGPLDFLHHNSIRTSISLAGASQPADAGGTQPAAAAGGLGDVMAITEEDYTRPTCQGQGSLQTWQITGDHNSDGTTKLTLLDQWTTELNELADQTGRSPATILCSAHWFDESGGLLAQGWYDQGVRFLDVSDPRNIRQVGYWVTAGTFWAAYFAPTDPTGQTVYGLDVAGGIDVLHIDRSGSQPAVSAPATEEMLAEQRTHAFVADPQWRYACPIASSAAGVRFQSS